MGIPAVVPVAVHGVRGDEGEWQRWRGEEGGGVRKRGATAGTRERASEAHGSGDRRAIGVGEWVRDAAAGTRASGTSAGANC